MKPLRSPARAPLPTKVRASRQGFAAPAPVEAAGASPPTAVQVAHISGRNSLLVALVAALSAALGLLLQGWLSVIPQQREIARLESEIATQKTELARQRLQLDSKDAEILRLQQQVSSSDQRTKEVAKERDTAAGALAAKQRPEAQLRERGYARDVQSFARAIGTDDAPAVQLFLDSGLSPTTLIGKNTALFYAAGIGSIQSLRLLLARGAPVNEPGYDGVVKRTPLEWAGENNKEEVVNLFLAAGAKTTCNAFRWAVYHGHTSAVQTMLRSATERKSLADCRDGSQPVLLTAIAAERLRITKLLVDAGFASDTPSLREACERARNLDMRVVLDCARLR